MRGFVLAAATACLLASVLPVRAASLFAPGQEWWTLTTEHFHLHYPAPLAQRARAVAPLLEAAHARLAPQLDWTPKGRTEVVLTDDFDPANGMTTVFPLNWIVLFASPPDGDLDLLLNPDGWMETLITHEYTHALHLDRAEGLPKGLRDIFGRIMFPNAYNPGWMTEGLATLKETENGHYGRGRGALFSGLLRAQAAEQKLPPLSKASHFYSSWPGGTGAYLYGVHFLQFLNDTFGEHTVSVLVREYSDDFIPYFVGRNLRKVVGQSPTSVWDRWRNALDRQAQLAGSGTPGSERISHSGFFTLGSRVSPDGKLVAWSEQTARDHARIMLAPADNPKAARELAWRNGGRALSWSADSRTLYISQPEFYETFRLYEDLYAVRLPKGKVRRLTYGARLRDPAPLPDGSLVAVQNDPRANATRLVRVDPSRHQVTPEVMYQPAPGVVLSHPRVAPGGGTIAVSASLPEGGRNIALVSPDGTATWITRGRARDADPAFSPDGRYVLFSSDRTGMFNLFAWDGADGSLWRITDEVGGAFGPVVDPAGTTIFYTGINGDGFDQYRMPFDPDAWEAVAEKDRAPATPPVPPFPASARSIEPSDRIAPLEITPSEPRRYSPFPQVLPHFWLPVSYGDADHAYYGAFTAGADPLLRHFYAVETAFDFSNQLLIGSLLYQYDRFWPTILFSASRSETGVTYDTNPTGWIHSIQFEDSVSLDVGIPWRRINKRASLQFGAEMNRRFNEVLCPAPTCIATPPSPSDINFVRGLVSWSNAQRYGLGISRTDGRTLVAAHKESSTDLGSDVDGAVDRLTWDEYLPLGRAGHVLHVRGIVGEADAATPFFAGGKPDFSDDPYDQIIPVRGQRKQALVNGTGVYAGTLEYRFPLALPEKGFGTLPAFLEKLHGRLFYDTARLYTSGPGWKGIHGGGVELGFDTVFGYYIPFTFLVGYANGSGVTGEDQVYLRVSLGE